MVFQSFFIVSYRYIFRFYSYFLLFSYPKSTSSKLTTTCKKCSRLIWVVHGHQNLQRNERRRQIGTFPDVVLTALAHYMQNANKTQPPIFLLQNTQKSILKQLILI